MIGFERKMLRLAFHIAESNFMKPRITARHFSLTEELRNFVSDRLTKLDRYYDGITDAHVILTVERGRQDRFAEIILTVYRQTLSASDIGPTHELAIDKCIEGLRRQLLKYKAKLKSTAKDYHK